ncbi:HpcH/HpaI aldolase family protein [Amorphus orientalis]|uniref:2-keto-3-deoxy-L-rhamnonate aldolase RhmA n=1 Tax=Amorphus orientalis TaxID=649198 RepID=A0AAE3VTU7_9HYPH|nr:aldolase/citrate lyase family protein [Amorphus orientalis]MDQ0317511.1 2-keto-3-deoxy-L-rhamnonate aldolase RhmA [Amorphus orientalis]
MTSLKARFTARERLIGTFVKTPHPMVIEVLAGTGLDFAILDAEHAPFGPTEIDLSLLAARAARLPILVRVPDARPSEILRVLDQGADGVLVPHVMDAAGAAALVKAANYGAGGRGYSATTRAGDYGARTMAEHLERSRDVVVVPQIEDPDAVEAAEAIAATEGLGACFVGPADLAVALGETSLDAPAVRASVDKVVAACAAAGLSAASFAPTMSAAAGLFERGINAVAVASDQKALQDFFSPEITAAVKDRP